MNEYLNCNNQNPPSYSGVTINITNPALNIPAQNSLAPEYLSNGIYAPYSATGENQNPNTQYINKGYYLQPVEVKSADNQGKEPSYNINPIQNNIEPKAYPQQYYINNYNNNGATPDVKYNYREDFNSSQIENTAPIQAAQTNTDEDSNNKTAADENIENNEENTETSKEIINTLNERQAQEKELEKNGKKTRVVALTNEYIMSLENYLNNPNTEIRLMAAKEILTRLDEDKNRYDDAALNALINKMLQDPNKLIRVAAMSALSSDLASGNDYTVELLSQIQQNQEADPEDVLEASQIMLKRTANTEVRYTPVNNPQQVQTIEVPQIQAQQQEASNQ